MIMTASTDCLTGECGADEENKEKFEENKTEKCNSDICPPGPVRLSHDEEHDKRNISSSCRLASGDPLCRPPVAADPNPIMKKGPADCSADSEDPDCARECSPSSSDPACARRLAEKRAVEIPSAGPGLDLKKARLKGSPCAG